MTSQYFVLLMIVLGGIVLTAVLYVLSVALSRHYKQPDEAAVTGLRNSGAPAWRRYHVHYYIFALLFLAFDMEMAFMYPWAVVFRELGLEAFADMGIFLAILFLGLLFAWSQRGLKRQ
jgi:NADH-quinone oxidoreductase subunit A